MGHPILVVKALSHPSGSSISKLCRGPCRISESREMGTPPPLRPGDLAWREAIGQSRAERSRHDATGGRAAEVGIRCHTVCRVCFTMLRTHAVNRSINRSCLGCSRWESSPLLPAAAKHRPGRIMLRGPLVCT